MNEEVLILVAEDNPGHAALIVRNLRRLCIENEIIQFSDGQAVLDYFFDSATGCRKSRDQALFLLLDLQMPKVSGVDVLRHLKEEPLLALMPIVVLTTTDDPQEKAKCETIGCDLYVTKPLEYGEFVTAIAQVGEFFLSKPILPFRERA